VADGEWGCFGQRREQEVARTARRLPLRRGGRFGGCTVRNKPASGSAGLERWAAAVQAVNKSARVRRSNKIQRQIVIVDLPTEK